MPKAFTTFAFIALLLFSSSSSAYKRAISLAPHITELIYAIGAEQRLVGTIQSSDYPPEAQSLPRVGDGIHLTVESLLALDPDVIFAWQPSSALEAISPILTQRGIALHYIHPQSLADINKAAQQLGQWLDQPEKAQQLQAQWHRLISQPSTLPKPSPLIFIVLGQKPLYSLNDPVINDVLHRCGATNWVEQSPNAAPIINLEELMAKPTNALIYSKNEAPPNALRSLLEQTYQQKVAMLAVDPDQFYRPGPRLFIAAEQLCHQLNQYSSTLKAD